MDPITIKKFDIYDVFHNDIDNLTIISPFFPNSPDITLISQSNIHTLFNKFICKHNHTIVYSINNITYSNTIQISIDNEIITTRVNKYNPFYDKTIISTMVKFEDNIIRQWIQYHLSIGIQHFIIYDNSREILIPKKKMDNNSNHDSLHGITSMQQQSNLHLILQDFIQDNTVTLINWPYQFQDFYGGGSGQTTQECHSIHAFNTSKFIGFFNVDEYINPQCCSNINNTLEHIILSNSIDINQVGSFRFFNKFFYNPSLLPTHDFEFLKIFNCDNIDTKRHSKHFVIPKNVTTFSFHEITIGKPSYDVNPLIIFFNHYCYLNKKNRGLNNYGLFDYSILKHLDPKGKPKNILL